LAEVYMFWRKFRGNCRGNSYLEANGEALQMLEANWEALQMLEANCEALQMLEAIQKY
jgi:hypothetical protein